MEELASRLFITLTATAASAGILGLIGIFVFLQEPRKLLNQLFFFLALSLCLYATIFIIASLQTIYANAYLWWSLTISNVLITIASVHLLLAAIGKDQAWKYFIGVTYFGGIILALLWMFEPVWFFAAPEAKLYFQYYREPGPLHSLFSAYFVLLPLIAYARVLSAYFVAQGDDRARYEYYLIAFFIGFCLGSLNLCLIFDIPVDPLFGSLLGVSFIPLAYGMFSVELLNVRIVAARALYFALAIAALSALFIGLIFVNDYLVSAIPYLRFWTVPVLAAVVGVIVARIVWYWVSESEHLKYEFLTIAAHKLRTPLTRIRWELDSLIHRAEGRTDLKEGLVRIDLANNQLIELTNMLLEGSSTSERAYGYLSDEVDLARAIQNSLSRFSAQIQQRGISVVTAVDPNVRKPNGDQGRLASVIDILIENAVVYNRAGGSVHISLKNEHSRVRFSVTDTGIGIAPEDRKRISSTFYRSEAAKRIDTEGVGIGLSIARRIIEKHGGTFGYASQGLNRGSEFWFTLPV